MRYIHSQEQLTIPEGGTCHHQPCAVEKIGGDCRSLKDTERP